MLHHGLTTAEAHQHIPTGTGISSTQPFVSRNELGTSSSCILVAHTPVPRTHEADTGESPVLGQVRTHVLSKTLPQNKTTKQPNNQRVPLRAVVMHTFNPSMREVEAGGISESGQPGLQNVNSRTDSLGYTEKP